MLSIRILTPNLGIRNLSRVWDLKGIRITDSVTYLPFFRLRFLALIPYNVLLLFIESESEFELCH